MKYRLRYLQHDFELSLGQFVIGRAAECQLSLDDPLVSRRHALMLARDNRVTIQDLGSANGTFINGRVLEPKTEYRVHDRDRLRLGRLELQIHFVIN